MMNRFRKIFLGNAPTDQRAWLGETLSRLQNKGTFDRVVIPCVGQFTLVKTAIKAGFSPEQIETSDISLFSTLLGHLYSQQPIDDIEFSLHESISVGDDHSIRPADFYDEADDEVDKAARILFLIKIRQFNPDKFYESEMLDGVMNQPDAFLSQLRKALAETMQTYEGVSYEIADVRNVLRDDYGEDTLMIVNPPAFGGGYEKMFPLEGMIDFDANIEQFSWSDELLRLYALSKEQPYTAFWYVYKDADPFRDEEVCFGREYSIDRWDHWVCTKPDCVPDDLHGMMSMKRNKVLSPYKNIRIVPSDFEITRDTDVGCIKVISNQALYYRDLWAHKMGAASAEIFYLLTLDGMAFGITGFMVRDVFRMNSSYAGETFGFNMNLKNYPNANRLLMYLITCDEMRHHLCDFSPNNRTWVMIGLVTTCISKYRDVKLNKGILRRTKREKLPTGLYKTQWKTIFRNESFNDALVRYLDEFEEERDKFQN